MPTFATTPKLLNSAETPANGKIVTSVTSQFATASGIVTRAAGQGHIVNGELKNADKSGPFVIPVTPDGTAVDVWLSINETRDNVPQLAFVHRTVSVPNTATVTWESLVDVIPIISDGEYVIPPYIAELLGVPAIVGEQLVEVNEAAAEVEIARAQAAAFAGTNNAQVANMVTAEGPTKAALKVQIEAAVGAGGSAGMAALEAAAKVGNGWFAKATAAPSAVDTPVVTVVPVANTTLPGGTIVKPLRLASDATKVDKAGDPAFFHSGTPTLTSNALDGTNYVIADWLPLGQPANRFYVIREDFLTGATAVVEIRVKPAATSLGYRISVGGKWLTLASQRVSGLTANGEYRIVLTFPSARVRHITFEAGSRVTTFGGVVVPAGQTVSRYEPSGIKFAVVGDSFAGGAGSPPDGAGYTETFPNFLAKLFGAGEFRNFGYGGSGYIASDAPYSTRLAAVLEYAPDVLIVTGSRNDGSNPSTLYQAVLDFLSALESVPQIYVTGPSTSGFTAANETVRAATLKAGREFIDGIEQLWILSPADIGADNVHPQFQGHQKIAKGIYANIGPIVLAGSAAAAPVVGDPTATVLTNSASPTQGAAVTLTATVTPTAATGTVEFKDGATVLGTSSLVGGVATLATSSLVAGARTLTAKYQPDTLDYATSTGVRSVTVLAPSILSAGTLAYWQGSAQPTGLPANNENMVNLAQAQAAAIIGSGDVTTLGFNHVVAGEAAGVLVRERTPKGGYHIVTSQTNALNTDAGSAVAAGIDLKTLINTYLVSNPTHQFAFSAWIRETRVQSGSPVRVTQQIAHLTSPTANFLTLIGPNPRPLPGDAKRLGYRETGAVTDLLPVSQAIVVDGFSGVVPSAGNLRASLAIWGNKGGLNTVAPRGASPSFVLYEFTLEDLSVAGAHTMAEFLAIDLARFNEAFATGGRYAADTVMDVALVP